MRKWISRLWVILPILLIVGSGAAAWIILHRPAPIQTVSETTCSDSLASDFNCWQQHYQAIVDNDSTEAAFVDFKQNYNANPYVKSNCHQIAHVIGRESAKKFSSLKETYSHGDNFCWSGYYHGAIETIAEELGPKKILSQINQVCADYNKNEQFSFNHYNCVHGMGHGLMAVQDDNLFVALKSCDSFEGQWQQESCYSGVFMENVMNEINPGEHSDYLKADDLLYPCDAVGHQYQEQCYLMQTSHMLKQVNGEFSKVFQLCSTVEAPYDVVCYQSLGRDVSGNSSSDTASTLANCQLGPTRSAQENCFTGAVKDFISYYHSDKQGLAMCASIPDASLAASCHDQAVDYYKTF
jgi:hypothetical protein